VSDRPAPGLRERKKQATRDALSWAALRLAVERGLDNVLVEDIAAAAGVSPRTFNNYFSSKAEAIASRHAARFTTLAAALRERPATEPLWDAITAETLELFGGDITPDPAWAEGVRLMTAEPALDAEFLKANALSEREIAEAVATRTRTDPETDPYPHLVAGAIGLAVRVASAQWMRADPPVPLGPLVATALHRITAGLPPD
jgi:AcrR family transcriptional regulator